MSILHLPCELLVRVDFLSSPCSNLYLLHPVITRALRQMTRKVEMRLLHSPSQLSPYSQLKEVVIHSLSDYYGGVADLLPKTVDVINIHNVMRPWILLGSIPKHVTSVTTGFQPLIWGRDYFGDLFGHRSDGRGMLESLNLLHEGVTTIRVNGGIYSEDMKDRPITTLSAEIDDDVQLPPTLTYLHNNLRNRGYLVYNEDGIEESTIVETLDGSTSSPSKNLATIAVERIDQDQIDGLVNSNVKTLLVTTSILASSLKSLHLTTLSIENCCISANILPRTLLRLRSWQVRGGILPDLIWMDVQLCLAKLPSTLRMLVCGDCTWRLAVGLIESDLESLHDPSNVPNLHTLDLAYSVTRGHYEFQAKDFPNSLTSLSFSGINRIPIRSVPQGLLHMRILSHANSNLSFDLPPRLQTLESSCILDEALAKRLPRTLSSLRVAVSIIGASHHLPPHLTKFTQGGGSCYGKITHKCE